MFKYFRIFCLVIGTFALLQYSIVFGKDEDKSQSSTSFVLTVGGEVDHPLTLNASDLAKMPRHVVRAKDHDGKIGKFEGVYVVDILKKAGVVFGKDLRGKLLSKYLAVKASDGYQVIFTLPELDPYYTDNAVLLADRRDDKPLSSTEGPLRIVIANEKPHEMHPLWIHQVTSFAIGHVEGYSKQSK